MEDLIIKAATVLAVALATFSSFPSTAQSNQDEQHPQAVVSQQNPSMKARPSSAAVQEPGAQAQRATENNNAAAIQLHPVKGELVGKLDSKSAKQGDSVVLKTEESVNIASGTEIPKGSKLIGHVTNVEQRGDGKQNSQIAIQFDRAELKGGQTLPIESVIQSLAPAAGETSGGGTVSMSGSAEMPNSESSAPNASAAGNPAMNNNAANQNNRPAMTGSTAAQPGAAQNTQTGAQAAGTIVARNGNVAIRTTEIPGILIANDVSGRPFSNASGLLLGARRDIKLDGGTQMTVAVANAPSGMTR